MSNTSNFFDGFQKTAISRGSLIKGTGALVGGIGGAMVGGGLGMLSRAKFEEKFKEDRDKTLKDKFLASAPFTLGLLGAASGGVHGFGRGKLLEEMISPILGKTAALRKEVRLKEHQTTAIDKLIGNDGSLLVAHATGSGKTLTGIAGFEKLKAEGKAKKAIVVVPASLRENFVKNLKQFTDSSHSVYGPKGEGRSKNVGDKSSTDYNIISYELFREHGDKILADTGADTIIMDEIHRVRGTEGSTYNKIRDLRPKFKNAITLTGSIVNNEPNDVVPLLDITYGPAGHKLVSKSFFDKLFVQKDAKTMGALFPKVHVIKGLKNKNQLAKYLGTKVDFISHKDLEGSVPDRHMTTTEVSMTKEQKKLYDFTMSSVDPITRWKIRNNLPVGQKEAKDAFSKLMQARQVSTDPGHLDKKLEGQDPSAYSPKVKAVVDDVENNLKGADHHKSVIFGNLLQGQLNAVELALKNRNIAYSKFVGLGNEGQTQKTRPKELQEFVDGKKRVLLISGAGAEGLDLKDANMLHMLEGHYNPERIQQAEARVRRMGSKLDKVQIRRYVSQPTTTGTSKFLSKVLPAVGLGGGNKGVDSWIYSIAENKDRLNEEFRDVLKKTASFGEYEDSIDSGITDYRMSSIGSSIGNIGGALLASPLKKRHDTEMEATMKQMLLDRGLENFTQKRHYSKILAESKLDERGIDAQQGLASLVTGASLLTTLHPEARKKAITPVTKAVSSILSRIPLPPGDKKGLIRLLKTSPSARSAFDSFVAGSIVGMALPPLTQYAKTVIQRNAIGNTKDLDTGIKRYTDKIRKKIERKYKASKGYVQEYDVKDELGIDQITGA